MKSEYIPGVDIDSLLGVLQELVEKAGDKEAPRPVVTVMCGPHRIEGTPIKITERSRDKLLVIHDAVTDTMHLLNADAINGVAIHHSTHHLEVVLDGKIPEGHAESSAPTRLALERQARDVEKNLSAAGSMQLQIDQLADAPASARLNLQQVLTALERHVAAARTDAVFAEAFAQVRTVALRPSVHRVVEVARDGDRLVVNVPSLHYIKALGPTLDRGISKVL